MKWTVVWQPTAWNLLTQLWNAGPDRTDIRNAADQIDWVLARDPLNQGVSRSDDTRILIELPLAVLFTVSPDDMLVTVFDVWRWGG